MTPDLFFLRCFFFESLLWCHLTARTSSGIDTDLAGTLQADMVYIQQSAGRLMRCL
jgi:hypothetical protein